ncbi:MAG TPA: ISAs1 family transposase [Clostridium sp.]|jgi:predicted transposase YbfD/YdcC|nr:ISAs1 family transposase [Clostridiales bacterium]HBC95399.1 ISAs1 family transposase [Clostridium sp.]
MGQVKADEKSNEITAIPELLKLLDINVCIVTIGAMGCQKETIIDKNSNYVLALKGNQKLFYDEVKEYLDDEVRTGFKDISHSYTRSFDKGHSIKDTREYYVTEDIDWLSTRKEWKNLRSIGLVIRKSEQKGKTPENLLLLRKFAFNILRNIETEKVMSGLRKRVKAMTDEAFLDLVVRHTFLA